MKTIIANWKMNLGIRESLALARHAVFTLQGRELVPQIVICPSFLAMFEVHKIVARTRVALGAQDCGPDRFGSYTGAIGTAQLEDVEAKYVIVGHSERRLAFGESDDLIKEKLKAISDSDLQPILCLGDTAEVKEANLTLPTVIGQLRRALSGVNPPKRKEFWIAYEPVWAIGSKTPALPLEVVPICKALREEAAKLTGLSLDKIKLFYGGSVVGDNAYLFLREPEIDGLLVGGASLKIKEFDAIVAAAVEVLQAQG